MVKFPASYVPNLEGLSTLAAKCRSGWHFKEILRYAVWAAGNAAEDVIYNTKHL